MNYLKNIGQIRRIDELGRIVIPKEIRKKLNIRDGENMEISVDNDLILLKKHQIIDLKIKEIQDLINVYKDIENISIMVSDREKIIATTNNLEYLNDKHLNYQFIKYLDLKKSYESFNNEEYLFDNNYLNGYYYLLPIINNIDSLGLIIIFKETNISNVDKINAKIMATLISRKYD